MSSKFIIKRKRKRKCREASCRRKRKLCNSQTGENMYELGTETDVSIDGTLAEIRECSKQFATSSMLLADTPPGVFTGDVARRLRNLNVADVYPPLSDRHESENGDATIVLYNNKLLVGNTSKNILKKKKSLYKRRFMRAELVEADISDTDTTAEDILRSRQRSCHQLLPSKSTPSINSNIDPYTDHSVTSTELSTQLSSTSINNDHSLDFITYDHAKRNNSNDLFISNVDIEDPMVISSPSDSQFELSTSEDCTDADDEESTFEGPPACQTVNKIQDKNNSTTKNIANNGDSIMRDVNSKRLCEKRSLYRYPLVVNDIVSNFASSNQKQLLLNSRLDKIGFKVMRCIATVHRVRLKLVEHTHFGWYPLLVRTDNTTIASSSALSPVLSTLIEENENYRSKKYKSTTRINNNNNKIFLNPRQKSISNNNNNNTNIHGEGSVKSS